MLKYKQLLKYWKCNLGFCIKSYNAMVSNETAATDESPETGKEKPDEPSDPEPEESAGNEEETDPDPNKKDGPKPVESDESVMTVIRTKKIPPASSPKASDGATSTSSEPSTDKAESFVTAQPTTATPVIFKSKTADDNPEDPETPPYISAKETVPPAASDEATDEDNNLEKIKDWGNKMFDWNVDFLLSVRGLLLIVQFICSLLVVALLAASCKYLMSNGENVDGYYCRHIDHFHFNVAIVSFSIAGMLIAGCVFSKASDAYIYHSVFEIMFYVLFCFFFLISSLLLLSNAKSRNKDRPNEYKFGHIIAASITGLVCCGVHGVSVLLKTIDYSICCFEPPIRMPIYPLASQNGPAGYIYQGTSPPPYTGSFHQGPYGPPPRYPGPSQYVPPPYYNPRY